MRIVIKIVLEFKLGVGHVRMYPSVGKIRQLCHDCMKLIVCVISGLNRTLSLPFIPDCL